MGRSYTPIYRLEVTLYGKGQVTSMAWNCKTYGQPTNRNLQRWVKQFEQSTRKGGANAHLGRQAVANATVIHQKMGCSVATYSGPSFIVV